MKIILITRDRPELTKQTVETMKINAANCSKHSLMVVYDGSVEEPTAQKLILELPPNTLVPTGKQLGVGGAKNFGVDTYNSWEQAGWGETLDPDTIIMFSDNDMYYLPNWDLALEEALQISEVTQLGGWKHPYHQVGQHSLPKHHQVWEVDAATGNCFVIRYKDWLKYGPFVSDALGPGQSEDFALSQKIKAGGGIVAALGFPVAIHCGLRNCEGKPAIGWQEMAAMAEKQLEENHIEKIWLEVPDEGTVYIERNTDYRTGVFKGLNVGSGQRRFDNSLGWINVDCASRPGQVPDIVLDATHLTDKFEENSQDMVVLHHVLEHFGCGEADEVLKQCYKVLRPGGSLLIFVPDLRKLAGRWLSGELDDFSYIVNVYGAYQGLEGDRHKWGYDTQSLMDYLDTVLGDGNARFRPFNWRDIPGADIAKDWWILGVEIIK